MISDADVSAVTDMKAQFVYDPLISKRQQFLLATQVCYSVWSTCHLY
jgi:hypothetical protein